MPTILESPVSTRKPLAEAKECHINYLLNGPFIIKDNKIVHSLAIDRDDLVNLYNYGVGGVRLYFCSENGAAGAEPYLSVIAVPYNENGENILVDNAGHSAIVNNLDPCPDKCPGNVCYTDSYSENDLNWKEVDVAGVPTKVWCKPNSKLPGSYLVWFDEEGNPVP